MKYFFILGSNPALSAAELSAVFNEAKLELINRNVLLLSTSQPIDAVKLIKNLGGTIKIGEIIGFTETQNKFLPLIESLLKPGPGKFNFGLSYYGQGKLDLKSLAMAIKQQLRQERINSRWVTSQEQALSSVVVEQNKLIAKGLEIVFIDHGSGSGSPRFLLGRTLAVQPFKQLSFRDYGRPARDDYSGLLPPKLAQMMLNLALTPSPDQGEKRRQVLLDPFCGSGTILGEAALMGYTDLIGIDISKKATANTEKNFNWLKEKFDIDNVRLKLYNQDAGQLAGLIKPQSINAIITEPYLGPQRGKFNLTQTKKELERLYGRALAQFAKILKTSGRLVMVWPIFHNKNYQISLKPDLGGFKIINPLAETLRNNKNLELTERQTIIYFRPQQKVRREIVILTKSLNFDKK